MASAPAPWIGTCIEWATNVVVILALVGLVYRRKYRQSTLIGIYLASALITDQMMLRWPTRFFNRSFWFGKELLLNVLMLGVAYEVGLRVLRAFPGARSTARLFVGLILIGTTVSLLPVWPDGGGVTGAAVTLQTRLLNGSVWLFSGLSAVILWYRLPVARLQKAVLVGFVPFLLASTAGLNVIQSATTPETLAAIKPSMNLALAGAYLGLVTYWAYVIWKTAEDTLQRGEPAHAAKNATQPL